MISSSGAEVASQSLAVIVTDPEVLSRFNDVQLEVLCKPFNREKVSRKACHQCNLGLAHTPVYGDEPIGLRSFDMWDMFFDVQWGREQFGSRQLYKHIPDLAEIFDKHGSYFAYKIYQLLTKLGATDEVALVCPEEANVEKLAIHLGILLQNRQVTIRIPADLTRRGRMKQRIDSQTDEVWYRQLSHLKSQRFANVVLIDETASSRATVRGMVRILQEFGLQPRAFIPVIDFSPGTSIGGTPTYPLYQVPNPRRVTVA